MMRSIRFPLAKRAKPLVLLLSLSAVSACAKPEQRLALPISPSAADVKAVITPKPVPTDDILTNDAASVKYGIAVEAWGDGLVKAGGRICRSLVAQGVTLPFQCPPSPSDAK